jgi:hypothetical protein
MVKHVSAAILEKAAQLSNALESNCHCEEPAAAEGPPWRTDTLRDEAIPVSSTITGLLRCARNDGYLTMSLGRFTDAIIFIAEEPELIMHR